MLHLRTLAFAFALTAVTANAAEYCPYRLVTFKDKDRPAEKRYGLVAKDDSRQDLSPTQVMDVTEEVMTSFLKRGFGHSDAKNFVDTRMNAELGQLMCELAQNPDFAARRSKPIATEQVLAAIPQPTNIVAMGLNAKAHAAELGKDGADGFIFAKNVDLTGAYDPIVRPAYSLLDYEVELGVVIRKEIKPGTEITPANVREYVAGFVLINDVSNRAPILLEKGDGKFTAAKTYRSFAPVGPYFVPIESVTIEAGRMLPSLKMYTGVLDSSDARNGDFTKVKTRQEGSTDEANFFTNLSGAVQMALKNGSVTDIDAAGKQQRLLKNGKFEPGDLLVMGTIAGVALKFQVKDGFKAMDGAITSGTKGDTMDIFWPHYKQFFAEGSGYDHGGPWPIKKMENWMRMKTWWVSHEYCRNPDYLMFGQTVMMGIEGLGAQVNPVIGDSNDSASIAEYDMMNDPVAMDYLCGKHGGAGHHLRTALAVGKVGAFVAGNVVLNKVLNRKFPCPPMGAAKIGCRVARVGLTAALVGLGLYSATDSALSGRLPTLAQMKTKPEYAEIVRLVGSSGKADALLVAIRGGASLAEAVEKHVDDPALRAETLQAIQNYNR